MNALVAVGLQNDFMAGGPLGVPGGELILSHVNELQGIFRVVVATQQWHPANHRSFFMNHTGRVAGERVRIGKFEQVLKPIHCVQNTYGAELVPPLTTHRVNKIIRLGTDADLDDDSGFFDANRSRSTGLSDYLQEKKVRKIYVVGLATDEAVMATALDGVGLGFKAWVVIDACRPAQDSDEVTRKAIEQLQAAGVRVVSTTELLSAYRAKTTAKHR